MKSNIRQSTPQDILKKKGLKATMQRMVTYDALLNCNNHPSAEELHAIVIEKNPTVSLGTIYKTLDTLVESGLAHKVHTSDGFMRYDGNLTSHNHIFCQNSQEILDYEDEELNQLLTEYFKNKHINNLKIEAIQVYIKGEKINLEKGIDIT